jgi:hypothetical protein
MKKKFQDRLNNYSMMFDLDGNLKSIKRNNKFYRFTEVEVLKDLIHNLGRDTLTISDVYQVIGLYNIPKVEEFSDRIMISNIIM